MRLFDTAGLRESADPLEQLGVDAALAAAAEADLVLVVRDATEDDTIVDCEVVPDPTAVPGRASTTRRLNVANKTDSTTARSRRGEWRVSARTGEGLEELTRRVVELLVPEEPPIGEALPVTRALAEKTGEWLRLARDNDRTR